MEGASADTFTLVRLLWYCPCTASHSSSWFGLTVSECWDHCQEEGRTSLNCFKTLFKEPTLSCQWSWPLNWATNPTVTLHSEQNGLTRTHRCHTGDERKQTNVCLWSTFLLVMPGTHSLFLFKPLWVEAIYYILWRFPRLWILSSWIELWKKKTCLHGVCFGSFSCRVFFFLFMNKFFIWMSTCMLPLCTHWFLFSLCAALCDDVTMMSLSSSSWSIWRLSWMLNHCRNVQF